MTAPDCDVLIVGAGPAGIAAAVRARSVSSHRVLLVDAGRSPGGQIWRPSAAIGPYRQQRAWLDRLARSGVETLARAAVFDVTTNDAGRFTILAERDGEPFILHARRVVLTTGARELFLPFPGWTLPGVVGVGGLQALLKSGVDLEKKRVVIAGSGPLLVAVGAAVARAGARVVVVAEQAPRRAVMRYLAGLWNRPSVVARAVAYRASLFGSAYRLGAWVTRAHGDLCVRAVEITDGSRTRWYDCDYLAIGYGLVPNTELARLIGCAVSADGIEVDRYQETSVPHAYAAGEPTGIGGVDLALIEGEIAGCAAVDRRDLAAALSRGRLARRRDAAALNRAFALRQELRALPRADTTICRCEDVSLGEVHGDWSARAAKLYTRVGMGACQGRICGSALHFLYGWTPDTVRPPTQPVLVSTLASGTASPSTAPDGVSH